jgi:hypothetical protein
LFDNKREKFNVSVFAVGDRCDYPANGVAGRG